MPSRKGPPTRTKAQQHLIKFPPSRNFTCKRCGLSIKLVKRNRRPVWIHVQNRTTVCRDGRTLQVDLDQLPDALVKLL